jgi:F-type H+-transporting ATPase subunit a
MSSPGTEAFKIDEYVLHHVVNSHEWRLPGITITLPSFISLHALMLIFCAVLLIVIFCFIYKKEQRVPTGFTNALEALVEYVYKEIAIPILGKGDALKFSPLLCTFFFFILGLNLIGMVPLFATATSNVNVTCALASVTLFLMTVGTIMRNGISGFFKALTPSGVPILILPGIVFLEFLGIFIKAFALMVRLFANMLAGHMVILLLLGLLILYGVYALPSLILAVAISALELFVAFLQAYIFTLLSAVFISQMHHPEH